jgi:hypothetical protein
MAVLAVDLGSEMQCCSLLNNFSVLLLLDMYDQDAKNLSDPGGQG